MFRLASIAAIAVFSVPAAGQIVGKPVYDPVWPSNPFVGDSRVPGPGVGRDLRDVHSRIEHARDTGDLTRREARQLRREAHLIERIADRYAAGGFSTSERGELQTRTQVLRDKVARAQVEQSGRR